MATFTNLVLKDGLATPADHNFLPSYRKENEMGWADRSAGVIAGFRHVSISIRPGTATNAGTRVTIKVKDPRLALVGVSDAGIVPNPVKAYETLAELTFMLPSSSDRQARLDILAYIKNALSAAQIVDTVVDLAQPV